MEPKKPPYVDRSQGEHLLMRGGSVFIKTNGAGPPSKLAMGTQQVLTGVGIPIHRHFEKDETFYVIAGRGTFVMDELRYPIEKGGAIFIPKLSWHGFENPDSELLLLWMMTPPGIEDFFRSLGTPPGSPAPTRSKDEVNQIARQYDTEFR